MLQREEGDGKMRRTRRRFLSLGMAVSMLLTYPTVPFTAYASTYQGLETKQKPTDADSMGDSGGGYCLMSRHHLQLLEVRQQ